MKRKVLAVLLVFCMLISILPTAAFAKTTGQISAPTNLQWVDNKGNISWNAVDGVEWYDVVVKKDGVVARNMQCRDWKGNGVCSVSVADMINQSGEYTFSVAALATSMVNGNKSSYTQCSDSFQYVRPSQEMSAPTSVQWRDGFMSWNPNIQTDKELRYDLHIYKEQYHMSGHDIHGGAEPDGYMYDRMHFVDDIVDRFTGEPDATLTFSVQAISDDISTIANSPIVHSENTVKIGDYLGKLPAPKGTEWFKDRNGEKTATLVFHPVANTYDYHVKLYRNDSLVHEADFSEGGFYTGGKIGVDLTNKMTVPGVYTAEVAALGNGYNTFDSDFTMCTQTFERGIAIDAPANVQWYDKAKGLIGWECPANYDGYELVIERNGGTVGRMGFNDRPNSDGVYIAYVGNLINQSGDYTVSVKTYGNGTTLEDSHYVISDVFEYKRPAKELATPKNVQWRDNFATWEEIEDANLNSYMVLYSRNGSNCRYDNIAPLIKNERGYISHNDNSFAAYALQKNDNQNYAFTVQANSTDLLNVANSIPSAPSAALHESAFRGKLNTPTGLTWSDKNFGVLEFYPVANTKRDMGTAYHVELYHNGEKILDADHGYGYTNSNGKNYISFSSRMTEYGVYTVKLRANGDNGYSTDSDYAVSASLEYTRPEQELNVPQNPRWVNGVATWNAVDNASHYLVDYYFNDNWNGSVFHSKTEVEPGVFAETGGSFIRRIINNNKTGDFTFTVTATSDNVNEIANSKPSEHSARLDLEQIAASVLTKLNIMLEILEVVPNGTAINFEEIYEDDSVHFAIAMATNPEVRDKMKTLEEKYKQKMNISVSVYVDNNVEIANELKNNVKIDGAALNSDKTGTISFNIRDAAEKEINKDIFKDCVFVNMHLESDNQSIVKNEDGTLKHPVRITMPVPEAIDNPDNFRVVHFFEDGSSEVIYPELSADKKEASFVLTHFSVFAFAEEVEADAPKGLKGDVNLDNDVNMDDVVALLNHVVKAETIKKPDALTAGEVTNDNELNMDDVVKLLNYVVKAIDSLD